MYLQTLPEVQAAKMRFYKDTHSHEDWVLVRRVYGAPSLQTMKDEWHARQDGSAGSV